MKLLVDMNLSPRWIPFLLDAGCEAVHWSTVGKADATDSEIMTFAAANDYVVLTNDLDFAAILGSTHHRKPSVVQIPAEDLDPNVIGTRIVATLQFVQKDLERGALLVLPFAIGPYPLGCSLRLPSSPALDCVLSWLAAIAQICWLQGRPREGFNSLFCRSS